MNLPNVLTIGALCSCRCSLAYAFGGHYWLAAVPFAAAALTDWLDGYVARKFERSG